MIKLIVAAMFTFMAAPWTLAQMPPPPPPEDFPKPLPPEGKKKNSQKSQELLEPERSGVKPPVPVAPPTPEPTAPEDQPGGR